MGRLFEPCGTPSTVEHVDYCINWCHVHPGWYWEYV